MEMNAQWQGDGWKEGSECLLLYCMTGTPYHREEVGGRGTATGSTKEGAVERTTFAANNGDLKDLVREED